VTAITRTLHSWQYFEDSARQTPLSATMLSECTWYKWHDTL